MTAIPAKIYSMEPVLEVNNLTETLKYYTTTLGFSVDWTWPEEGEVNHASVSFGEGHQDDHHDEYHIHLQLSQAENTPVTSSGWLYLRVKEGIDELYQNLKDRGANLVTELKNQPWGMREFQIRDNNGHLFRFAYHIPEE